MLELAIDYAKNELNATKITLGVFKNNPAAQHCYEAVGFTPVSRCTINIQNTDWECIEMEINL